MGCINKVSFLKPERRRISVFKSQYQATLDGEDEDNDDKDDDDDFDDDLPPAKLSKKMILILQQTLQQTKQHQLQK